MPALEPYFKRIGYTGGVAPTLETLRALSACHVAAVPFENLDVLLGRRIDLSPEALEAKLVGSRRGGYCFEQNGFFLEVLQQLGFSVVPLSARVRLQRPRDFTPPRTHVFLRVELDGASWLADVGVGALSLTAPLRLHARDEQVTPHETRRIIEETPGRWFHQVKFGTEWADVCEFTLEQMPLIDREVANWFTATHPNSHFKNRLMAARAGPQGTRLTLLNREFTVRQRDGSAKTHVVQRPAELLEVLATEFELHFPKGTEFSCEQLVWG